MEITSQPKESAFKRRLGCAILAAFCLLSFTAVADAATFDVNIDSDAGGGGCDLVECTFREAIDAANANAGPDTITFAGLVGGMSPVSQLPDITDQVTIDGETIPGFPTTETQLYGPNAGPIANGLVLTGTADSSVIRGLTILDFPQNGIVVDPNAEDVEIRGNYLGVDRNGFSGLPNGVGLAFGGTNGVIGGNTAADRNVVSGNILWGIHLNGEGTGNQVIGNYVGVDPTGQFAIGNGVVGIHAFGAGATIGGPTAAERNLVSGNGIGIEIDEPYAGPWPGMDVIGNYIGTDLTGTAAIPNTVDGIRLRRGYPAGEISGNLISGNGGWGIHFGGPADPVDGYQVSGNLIGTDLTGLAPLGNTAGGIFLDTQVEDVVASGDTIAHNGGPGFSVEGGASTGNRISQAVTFDNTGLAVDLAGDGVTANDADDADSGPNELQNYPVITAAEITDTGTDIAGTLDSLASTNFTIEFYSNPTCDSSGNGEGRTYLGNVSTSTNGSGDASFNTDVGALPVNGEREITAVATNQTTGSSSEFSACEGAVNLSTNFDVNDLGDSGDGLCDTNCTLRDAILEANSNPNTNTITFSTISGGTIFPGSQLPAIAAPVTIDGESATGWTAGAPAIELDGDFAGGNEALKLTAASSPSTVQGLVINTWTGGTAILVEGGSTGAVIRGNWIGTNLAGTAAEANGSGVRILGSGTTLGGSSLADRNVISGNTNEGVYVEADGPGTVIRGNYIGTNAAGTAAVANDYGLSISDLSTDPVTIGGASAGQGNVISGSNQIGVGMNVSGSTLVGNRIGTNAAGTAAIPNNEGVFTNALVTNIEVRDNQISGNTLYGFENTGATGTQFSDNLIGTNATGTAGIPNGYGVTLGSSDSTFDGDTIAFNTDDGIRIVGDETVQGNDFTDVSIHSNGGLGVDLGDDGVTLNDPGDNDNFAAHDLQNFPLLDEAVIDGPQTTATGSLNSISTTNYRVDIYASSACDPSGFGEGEVKLASFNVTTDLSSNAQFSEDVGALPVGKEQITATATSALTGSVSEFSACVEAGEAPPPPTPSYEVNSLVDSGDGTCDGTCTLRDAILAANAEPALKTITFTVSGSINPQGSPLPALVRPVNIDGASAPGFPNTRIAINGAGAGPGAGLSFAAGSGGSTVRGIEIYNSQGAGIAVPSAGVNGVVLRNNLIQLNSGLGIDLGPAGVNPNDSTDADTGSNDLQNFPVLDQVKTTDAGTDVEGSIRTTADTAVTIDFYTSSTCDGSGFGEGAVHQGSATVNTDGSGEAALSQYLPVFPTSGFMTATATTTSGTSEFSACRQVEFIPFPPPVEPEPQNGKTGIAGAVTGTVTIRRPGGRKVKLVEDQEIPVGSIIDATRGRMTLTTATGDGKGTQTAQFYAGAFKFLQAKGRTLVTLVLVGGKKRNKVCKPKRKKPQKRSARVTELRSASISSFTASISSSRTLRKLWGSGKGKYTTKGSRGSATVRGTIWLTADRCDGTFFKVREGIVAVKDVSKKKKILLRKGKTYLAKAGR